MALTLAQLLDRVPPETEREVDAARRRFNPVIREILRKETRLLLNPSGHDDEEAAPREAVSIPVRVVPGAPEGALDQPLEGIDELILLLGQHRRMLRSLAAAAVGFHELLSAMAGSPIGKQMIARRADGLPAIRELVAELLARLDAAKPLDVILQFNEDILGVYTYRLPRKDKRAFLLQEPEDPMSGEIYLYWGVIGVVAPLMGVSVEALAVKVLAHELAHAYTHLGADIDGHRWPSVGFSEADHELKEGLAQYYALRACQRLQQRIPGALEAYVGLLPHQPDAYRTHVAWLKDGASPEEIRIAMLEIRRRGDGTLSAFGKSLKVARARLRNHQEQE